MADMPARIWALPGATRGFWSPTPSKHPNSAKVGYIRADLVEQMAAALRDSLRSSRKDFRAGPIGDQQHREAYAEQFAALQAYEAAQ
jgi:hypothetical protein